MKTTLDTLAETDRVLNSLASLASFVGLSYFAVFTLFLLAKGVLTKRQLRSIMRDLEENKWM